MKLDNATEQKVEGSRNYRSGQFNISDANSAHMFKMLTTYSDPIGGVVREITSNCFDAHRKADVDKDVIIRINRGSKLNGKESQIQFIDFGTGLTPDEVENIFTVLGESTKRGGNKEIGAFGIGAKSPFGYIRNNDLGGFTVDTYVDGKHWQYVLAEDAEDGPIWTLVDLSDDSESDENWKETNRENGTIVSISIADGDYYSFKRKIRKELAYFDNIEFQVNDISSDYTIYRGENFVYRPDNSPYNKIHACFGKVAYPLDFDELGWDTGGYSDKEVEAPIALYFDIGEIQVTPQREQINYTDKTIETINSRLEDAQEEFQEMWENAHTGIKTIEDLLEARENSSNSEVTVQGVDIPFCEKLIPDSSIDMDDFDLDLPDNIFYMFESYKCVDQEGYIKSNINPSSLRTLIKRNCEDRTFFVEDKYSPKTNRYIASRFGEDFHRKWYLVKKRSFNPTSKYIIDDPAEDDWEPDDDNDNPLSSDTIPLSECDEPEIHKARLKYKKFYKKYSDDKLRYDKVDKSTLKEIIEFEKMVEEYVLDEIKIYDEYEPSEDFKEWEKKKREQKEKAKKKKRENEFPIKILDTDDSGWGSPEYKWSMDDMEYDSLNNSTLYIYGFQEDSDDLLDIAPIIYSNNNFYKSSKYGRDKLDRNKVAILKIAMKREYLFEDLDNAMHISEFQKGHHIIDRAYHASWVLNKISSIGNTAEEKVLARYFPNVGLYINSIVERLKPYKFGGTTPDSKKLGVQVSEEKNYIYQEDTIKWLEYSHDAIKEQLPLVKNMEFGGYYSPDMQWDEFKIYVRNKDLVHPKLWAKYQGIID